MGHIPIFPSQRQLGVLHNYLFFIKFNDLGIVIHILQFHILDNNTFFFVTSLGCFLTFQLKFHGTSVHICTENYIIKVNF